MFGKNIKPIYNDWETQRNRFQLLESVSTDLSSLHLFNNKNIANTADGSGVNITDLLSYKEHH